MRFTKIASGILYLLTSLTASVVVAETPTENLIHVVEEGAAAALPTAKTGGSPAGVTVIEDGFLCTVIDFEGVGNLSAIPVFDGISSPGWLGIIDGDAGGSGNIAFEPSPETIAFWLGGASGARDIVFSSPVSKVGFAYASFVNVGLEAFDQDNVLLDSVLGPANFNQGPGGDPNGSFNQWDPLEVSAGSNVITRARVSGNVNQTGIDNLKVCTALGIHSVEPTQAIQELQEIDVLKADLQADGEPPVAIIEGKPMALRVYPRQVSAVTTVEVELDLQGVAYDSRSLTLQPHCTPELYRAGENGCQSIDFTFVPPVGSWTASLRFKDQGGQEIEAHELPFTNRPALQLILRAVSICDARVPDTAAGVWQCANASDLIARADFLRRTVPTGSVTVEVTSHHVRRRTAAYDADGDGDLSDTEMESWWSDTVRDVGDFFDFNDSIAKLFGQDIHYYGMVRPSVPGGRDGMADFGQPSHGAISRTSVFHLGVETHQEVVARQVGHMLARRGTNVAGPTASVAPGCYATAVDRNTDWPFADNRIQSAARLEVGFDVSTQRAVDPESTFDWMSFCTPSWISPFTYARLMEPLSPPGFKAAESGAGVFGPFWKVKGFLGDAGAGFEPIFTLTAESWTEPGTGSHRLEVRDAAATVLFTRFFTPDELPGGRLVFHELLPVQENADRIVVLGGDDAEVLSVDFGGSAPSVVIDGPAGGEVLDGESLLEWSFSDPDSSDHLSWVEYSWDQGQTWASQGFFQDETVLTAEFARLPGASDAALIRVRVSDGVHTGSAVSMPFSVADKTPTAAILAPDSGTILRFGDLVWLRAEAYDVDDGVLDGDALHWESSRDGVLGSGASLSALGLSPGHHELTLTATDSDGNATMASTGLEVAGSPPSLDFAVEALDQLPTTCVRVSIDAWVTPQGSELRSVEYSLDGGSSWVELKRYPTSFLVPGSGFFHVAARAVDVAGQVDAADTRFFIDSPCQIVPMTPRELKESALSQLQAIGPTGHAAADEDIEDAVRDIEDSLVEPLWLKDDQLFYNRIYVEHGEEVFAAAEKAARSLESVVDEPVDASTLATVLEVVGKLTLADDQLAELALDDARAALGAVNCGNDDCGCDQAQDDVDAAESALAQARARVNDAAAAIDDYDSSWGSANRALHHMGWCLVTLASDSQTVAADALDLATEAAEAAGCDLQGPNTDAGDCRCRKAVDNVDDAVVHLSQAVEKLADGDLDMAEYRFRQTWEDTRKTRHAVHWCESSAAD